MHAKVTNVADNTHIALVLLTSHDSHPGSVNADDVAWPANVRKLLGLRSEAHQFNACGQLRLVKSAGIY
jgi:hypothetical protein